MHKTLAIAFTAAAWALAGPWAGAQTVWRCGNSYSQQPCPGGAAVATSAARPSAAEAAAAARVASTDARLAAEMERARLARERNAPQAIVIGPQPAEATAPAKGAAKRGTGKPEHFTAVAPGGRKKPKRK